MYRYRIALLFAFSFISVALVSALLLRAPEVSHAQTDKTAPAVVCPESWTSIQAMEAITGSNRLSSIAAISANDVWAVGSHQDNQYMNERPVTMHWNGTQWRIVSVPDVGVNSAYLSDVAAVSSNDVWAVGSRNGGSEALIIHWNGTAWSLVSVPPPAASARLSGVTVIASNDVWAVGSRSAIHWDGLRWNSVAIPDITHLHGVDAISSNDVWAVGEDIPEGAAAIHWDGVSWSQVPVPSIYGGRLYDVSASAPNNVWALGLDPDVARWDGNQWSEVVLPPGSPDYFRSIEVYAPNDVWIVSVSGVVMHWNGNAWNSLPFPSGIYSDVAINLPDAMWAVGSRRNGTITETLTIRWNGSTWVQIPSPNVKAGDHTLRSIDALSSNDIWAVGWYGYDNPPSYSLYPLNLAEHWDGQRWTKYPTPNESEADFGGRNYLNAIAAISTNDVWAVGYYTTNATYGRILHWNGSTWERSQPAYPGVILTDVSGSADDNVWAVGHSAY
jgi:hypothetical protein